MNVNQLILLFFPIKGLKLGERFVDNKKRPAHEESVFCVRVRRVELPRANAHHPLKVACLPFHHIRDWDCKDRKHF